MYIDVSDESADFTFRFVANPYILRCFVTVCSADISDSLINATVRGKDTIKMDRSPRSISW